jgi:hypothetical protein
MDEGSNPHSFKQLMCYQKIIAITLKSYEAFFHVVQFHSLRLAAAQH